MSGGVREKMKLFGGFVEIRAVGGLYVCVVTIVQGRQTQKCHHHHLGSSWDGTVCGAVKGEGAGFMHDEAGSVVGMSVDPDGDDRPMNVRLVETGCTVAL